MPAESVKKKFKLSGAALAVAAVVLFIVFELFSGISPSAVRVLDARVTFKFTAYHDKDQYFISYSLENTKKTKAKAVVRVQLGETSLGGRVFHGVQAQNDNAVLEPLETKAFVLQMDVPKKAHDKERELDVRAKVKRVSRF